MLIEGRQSVLAVDDDKNILNLVGITINLAGLNAETTQDPHHALTRYEASARDIPVVVTDRDYKLTDIDGESFACQIRRIANRNEPPLNVRIIMITGDTLTGQEQTRMQGMGVDLIMAKPFSLRALSEEIARGRDQFIKGK